MNNNSSRLFLDYDFTTTFDTAEQSVNANLIFDENKDN